MVERGSRGWWCCITGVPTLVVVVEVLSRGAAMGRVTEPEDQIT